MRLNTLLVLALLLIGTSRANAYYEPANFQFSGKTIAEKQVQWAWWVLPTFLQACQFSTDCGLNPEQMGLLKRVVGNLKSYSEDTVQFKSEHDDPALYRSDLGEVHRLAMTGLSAGAPIYVNNERLNQNKNLAGFALWMGFLSHEMIHHLGINDDDKRVPDQFGAAITKAAESLLSRWTVAGGGPSLEVWLLNFPIPMVPGTFAVFPKGLMPVPVYIDSKELYNISNLSETVPPAVHLCQTGRMLGLRASPLTEKFRPAKVPGNQSEVLSYDLQLYCLEDNSGTVNLKRGMMTNIFDFSPAGPNTLIVSDSFVSSFGDVDSVAGSETRVEWLEGKLASDRIQAGTNLTLTAQVRDIGMGAPAKTCGARLSRPDWSKFGTGVPLSVYQDTCTIVKHQGDAYDILITRQIPPNAAPGAMTVDSVCLSTGDPNLDGCYVATPPRALAFQILNSAVAPLKIISATIVGAHPLKSMPGVTRYYYINKGARFTLSLEIAGATEALEAFLEGEIVTDKDRMAAFSGPLLSPDKMFVKSLTKKKTKTGMVLDFNIELFTTFEGLTTKLLKFWQLLLISPGLQATTMQFKDYDFAVMFVDYVPPELR